MLPSNTPHRISCWIVSEDLAGTRNQCLGVAEALGLAPDIKTITLKEPWKTCAPYLGWERAQSFSPSLLPPWPDLLIASGRKSIAASRYIKRASRGKTFTVQIQDPRISPRHFDLVAVPAHDPTRGKNVLVTMAAPNRITPANLAVARAQFAPLFESLPQPRIAVLIGGSSAAYTMTPQIMETLAQQLKALQGSLMITTSRRTGAENTAFLKSALKGPPHYFWEGSEPNPYMGLLAMADVILVTADSTSMLSEAATTGKPVYMIDLEGGTKRLNTMQENLICYGAVRRFEGVVEQWTYQPLHDARIVAEALRKKLGWI